MKKFRIDFVRPLLQKFRDCVTSAHFEEFKKLCEDLYSRYLCHQNVCSVVSFRDLNYSGSFTRSHNHYLVVLRFTDSNKQKPVYFVIHHRSSFYIYSCKSLASAGKLFDSILDVNYYIEEASDNPVFWFPVEDDDSLPF